MKASVRSFVLAAAVVAAASGPSAAQQGAITGRVTDASTLEPVPLARITVVGSGPTLSVVSESDGSFELRLSPGVYDLLVESPDFEPKRFERVRVRGGLTTTTNLPIVSADFRLAGFVVTPSRRLETEITAPSSSHSVGAREIAERPAPSLVEHVRESPGVDIGTQGIQASNIVVRGFNNIFSGALRMLTDYRVAGLPALRVNFMHFLPQNDADIERMEVVLGPGAALYGPNTANGMLHLITKSPLEDPGTTVSLGMGEQSIREGAFRSALKVNEDFAVKLSGQFLLGQEWPFVDSSEVRHRDFRVRRYGMEARADWRYSRRGTLVGTYGATDATGIELTGLGAAQTNHWRYEFVQGRFTYDRWAIQAYFNFNNSGDGAYKLTDGMPLVDRSRLGAIQIQNGFTLADGRQDFTYGWDYFSTRPRSGGTIYGDYEGDNDIQEWGLYLQSRTSLSPKVDFIAAGRIDAHSILPDEVFSPRLALVVKPNAANAVRFAYNRAFETPTALNYFLDLGFGSGPFSPRAFGSGRNGFALLNADGQPLGMRSPLNPGGGGEFLDLDVGTLWRLGLGAAVAQSPLPPDVLAVLQGLNPRGADVGLLYLDTNRRSDGWLPLNEVNLADVAPIREGSTETLEAGWSGVLKSALRVSLDLYYLTQHDFVSPLVAVTPLISLDAAELERWLGSAYLPARTEDLVRRLGLSTAAATAQATEEVRVLGPSLAAGLGGTALAVVSSDVPQMGNGGADVIATYRNLGDLSLWGADASLEWLLSRKWTLRATYSHVSRFWFEVEGSEPLALNAPKDKGTFGAAFRDEARGLSATARVRYTGGFPFLSTVYDGSGCMPGRSGKDDCIAPRTLVDVTMGYRVLGTRATVQLGVNNLLNTPYRSFVGVPASRRLAMARVRYDFF